MRKLYIKPIIYTLLILIAITTFTCDVSKSKYIKEDGEAIKYSVYIKKMSGTPLNSMPHGILGSSTYETVNFYYTFNRSGNMVSTDFSETYEIVPKNTCSITSVTIDNVPVGNSNIVTFSNPGNEVIAVYLSCNVDASLVGNNINIYMNVNNYFNNVEPKFLYTNGINNINLDEYYVSHPKPEVTDFYSNDYKTYKMTGTRENKLDGLKTWFGLFAAEYPVITYDNIYNYIDFIQNEDDITEDNISLLNNYEGLSAEIDTDGNYVFTVDDRFTSLVMTHKDRISTKFYFFDGNYDIDELFLYYIDYYDIYPEGSTEYTEIVDYLNETEVDDETILDLVSRLGLAMIYDSEKRSLDGVEDFYNYIAHIIPVYAYDKTKPMGFKYLYLKKDLNNITVLTGTDLFNQIVDTTNTKISNLFAITDVAIMFDSYIYLESTIDGKNAILHIYSNDETSTYVEITFVDSNTLTYDYGVIDNDSIKSDLSYISTTLYSEELSLLDTDPTIVENYNSLENGTYNLNIGTVTISNNKAVIITLKDRNITQSGLVLEEQNIESNNNEEVNE